MITREDIETSGLTTLNELISDRSNYNNFGLYRPLVLGYRILINGRYPAGSLDLLPLSAVERIEILNNDTANRMMALPFQEPSTSCSAVIMKD
ncbi:hypothetical protein [Candidatus Synechococcus spongiarum]|uniref:hypothetical protein n=1 Tax=Candidatus Synechococcus spongiarum TaxID=431041 RepID=UPI0004B26526|nr:hypothetical protein [Candidatus Synechococcus spongiarum]